MQHGPLLLCILDGVGINPDRRGNAVLAAKTPTLDKLNATCPWTTLVTHGERVGLPAGQMGNSEVGHLNIGAGRVVEQWLERVSKGLQEDKIESNPEWQNFIKNLQSQRTLHIAGLYSRGGVHSHAEHLILLLNAVRRSYQGKIALHLFSDGRDVAPGSIVQDIKDLLPTTTKLAITISTLSGRYYAMDRDKRWERTELAFKAIVLGQGEKAVDAVTAAQTQLDAGVTDEFFKPVVISPCPVTNGDSLLLFNFREDRMRQITAALCDSSFSGFARNTSPFNAKNTLCFTDYDPKLNLPVLFHPIEIKNHLGEVVAQNKLAQLRAAETEKYPHVTYFFNGGAEAQLPLEERLLVPSPRDVATYDLKPEMSAVELATKVIEKIREDKFSLIVLNFANCDMVGHTGVVSAAIKAVETVDKCLGLILEELQKHNGTAVILADHGNSEQMVDYQLGTALTSHTTFPVPLWVWGKKDIKFLKPGGTLCDVAPTCLEILGLKAPNQMTGSSLIGR